MGARAQGLQPSSAALPSHWCGAEWEVEAHGKLAPQAEAWRAVCHDQGQEVLLKALMWVPGPKDLGAILCCFPKLEVEQLGLKAVPEWDAGSAAGLTQAPEVSWTFSSGGRTGREKACRTVIFPGAQCCSTEGKSLLHNKERNRTSPHWVRCCSRAVVFFVLFFTKLNVSAHH